MKRKKYTKEPKRLNEYRWMVRGISNDAVWDDIVGFTTKAAALRYIRSDCQLWPDDTYELFKVDYNFVEAWTK
jgi:hypothetical protein